MVAAYSRTNHCEVSKFPLYKLPTGQTAAQHGANNHLPHSDNILLIAQWGIITPLPTRPPYSLNT